MTNALVDVGRQWDKEIIPVLRATSVGRKLIARNNKLSGKGIGNTSVKSYGYGASAAAVTNYHLITDYGDTVNVEDATVAIPIQQDEIRIHRRTYDSMVYDGMTPQSDQAQDMAMKPSVELDQLIIDGWKPDGTNYEIKGLYQVAGNSTAGADFGTYGNAVISCGTLIGLLQDDTIYSEGYNLTLATAQYQQLLGSISSTGVREMPQVLEMLNAGIPDGQPKPGRIYQSSVLTAATGLITPVATEANMIYMDLIEAQQPTNTLYYENGNTERGDIILQQIGAAVPRFRRLSSGVTNAVGKFTAI